MSVSDGQPVSAAVTNAAYLSKTTDSTGVAIYTLNNGDAASGASIPNLQGAVNNSQVQTYVTENVTASGTIATDTAELFQYRRVAGDSGPQTTSSTPFGSGGGWADGMVVRLVGTDNTNTVTLQNNDAAKGAILNGDIELAKYDMIDLQYDSVLDRWIEVGRNS